MEEASEVMEVGAHEKQPITEGRNRKRQQSHTFSSGDEDNGHLDDSLPEKIKARKKRRCHFASSDDEGTEEGEDGQDVRYQQQKEASPLSQQQKKLAGKSLHHGYSSVTTAVREEENSDQSEHVAVSDPWENLEDYSAKLRKEYPTLDPLIVQDALIQNEVRMKDARATLTTMMEGSQSSKPTSSAGGRGHPQSASKEIVYDVIDTSEDRKKYHILGADSTIYDSDDESDNDEETVDRRIIVQFLQDASLSELLKIRGLSDRKAKILLESRPFTSWKQFISTVRGKKYIHVDGIVESTKDYLNARTTVSKIIRRCQLMADRVDKAMALHADETIDAPHILSKGMKLQGYQLVALHWLSVLHKSKMNGILADEMGLGKTIQSIAFIAYLLEHGVKGPFLVIAPASTIDNWDDEFRRWAPSIRTVVYHGSLEDRAYLRQEYFSPAGLLKMEVVITTYQGATRNVVDKAAFKRLKFDFAIFDEAHLLKNMMSQKYRALMSTVHASGRLLLTGTPVQNNLTELLSLLVFAMPEMLSKDTQSLEHAFTYISNESSSSYELEQVKEARAILKPFILRRTKEDVALELPAKTSKVESVPMSKKQKSMYQCLIARYAGNSIAVREEMDMEIGQEGLEALHQMRKLANHPLLVRNVFTKAMLPELAADLIRYHPRYKSDTAVHLAVDLEFMSDFQLHTLCMVDRNIKKYRLKPEDIVASGKFEYLDKMLPLFQSDDRRILLFSQYTQVLDIVQEYLTIRKYQFARIDGQTPVGERQDIVDRFNRDTSVFVMLLSTRAGGLGINLTGADTVIIHDIDFNPYNDKQAENRCHRLGQKREVSVYRLISHGTVEEKIYEMGQKKLQLEKNVMDIDVTLAIPKTENEELDVETAKVLLRSLSNQ